MRTTTFFVLFLLSAFTSYLPSSTAFDVLDINGDSVPYFSDDYFLIAHELSINGGGGLDITRTGNETCPLSVIQNTNSSDYGTPIKFRVDPSDFPAPGVFNYVNIQLSSDLKCSGAAPSDWTALWDDEKEKLYVKIKGYDNTVSGSFQIRRALSLGYNLLFCPSGPRPRKCTYLAVEVDDGENRRLVVTESYENRLVVKFKKLEEAPEKSRAYD
ncbi:kunitz-type trypsin inhibitor KTI1-like [Vigna umbellata]|uniref:kunitz-type trypsin inhibitor KTI1-like n=1 Tax=Vigna umbellata TaxID=87088 RepID=UPI001F5FD6DF|nr:kunitz-type trypsin inhibitor KTI1-like [Vigna umbellata]